MVGGVTTCEAGRSPTPPPSPLPTVPYLGASTTGGTGPPAPPPGFIALPGPPDMADAGRLTPEPPAPAGDGVDLVEKPGTAAA